MEVDVNPIIKETAKGKGSRFCGPAAMSIIGGIATDTAAWLYREASGKPAIRGVHCHQTDMVLARLGYAQKRLERDEKDQSLADWALKDSVPNTQYLLVITGRKRNSTHYVSVKNDYIYCNNIHSEHGKPVHIASEQNFYQASRIVRAYKIEQFEEGMAEKVTAEHLAWRKGLQQARRANAKRVAELTDQIKTMIKPLNGEFLINKRFGYVQVITGEFNGSCHFDKAFPLAEALDSLKDRLADIC